MAPAARARANASPSAGAKVSKTWMSVSAGAAAHEGSASPGTGDPVRINHELIHRSRRTGGGVVADSVPEREDEECRNKAAAVLRAVATAAT